jgi:hypothetical protein
MADPVAIAVLDPFQNPSSPYYLHPIENPSFVISAPVLDGANNYLLWARNVHRALICKYKLGFITGDLKRPQLDEPLHNAWVKCDTMVTSWITKTVSAQIARSIAFFDTSQALWQELHDCYSKSDHFRYSNLLQAVHSI